jgi:hypothetical protein
MAETVPPDMVDLVSQTSPTVAAVLQKSIEALDPETRERYGYLGVFAPKPATFDAAAMASMWEVENPLPTLQILVDRGLLEPIPGIDRFQMHSMLVSLAHSLLENEN